MADALYDRGKQICAQNIWVKLGESFETNERGYSVDTLLSQEVANAIR